MFANVAQSELFSPQVKALSFLDDNIIPATNAPLYSSGRMMLVVGYMAMRSGQIASAKRHRFNEL